MKLLAKTPEERYQTAAGVERDLRRCLDDWESRGAIAEFSLGERDHSDRLLIPEKLYGREREIETLLAAFDAAVASGKPQLVLVSGYSGIGKSSVVSELHKVLVPPRGLFASGKFDQLKRDVPYATLAQAFQSLIRQLLGKPEAELAEWREQLRQALNPNGALLVDLIPELKFVIGEQPAVPDVPPADAKARFQMTLRRLIGVFARAEHPLALFLDDLQWLDGATLDLLENILVQPEPQHLLLVGAYRDNEVDAAHPLMRKLSVIRESGAVVQEIVLGPLEHRRPDPVVRGRTSLSARTGAAAGAAGAREDRRQSLLRQSIPAGARRGRSDHLRAWRCRMALGPRAHSSQGLHGQRRRPHGRQVEPAPAHHPGSIEGTGLPREHGRQRPRWRLVHGTSEEQLHSDLWEALRLELIVRSDDSYRFVHDRVQEAAYSLVPEEQRAAEHLRIGRLLTTQIAPDRREEAVFEIVGHFNRATALITVTR